MMKIYKALAFFIVWGLVFPYKSAVGKVEMFNKPVPGFELNDGDRVVFLGNSLFENDLEFGYFEFALSTRWKELNITFRNLGLSGDTVFGEARGYFTNPPSPYTLMIEQIRQTRPTVVFLAYGANESEAGEKGIFTFKQGLNQLLDSIQGMGAKTILLSPIPLLSTADPENFTNRNKNIALYAAAISDTASERELPFVDLFHPLLEIHRQYDLTDNGVHLNENGYFQMVSILENGLGLSSRSWSVNLDLTNKQIRATVPAKILDAGEKHGYVKFSVKENLLPLPVPVDGREMGMAGGKIQIVGLRRGIISY